MQNFMELDMRKNSDPKALTFGVWDLKPNLGQFKNQNLWQRTFIKPFS